MFSAHCPLHLSHILDVVFLGEAKEDSGEGCCEEGGCLEKLLISFLLHPNWAKVEIRQL